MLARKYGIVGVALGTTFPLLVSKIFVQPVYVCRIAGIDYLNYLRRMGRTILSVIVALVLPSLLTVKFVAPDYKMLSLVGTLSALAYAATLWRLEFSPGETNLLRQVIWPRLAVKRGGE